MTGLYVERAVKRPSVNSVPDLQRTVHWPDVWVISNAEALPTQICRGYTCTELSCSRTYTRYGEDPRQYIGKISGTIDESYGA